MTKGEAIRIVSSWVDRVEFPDEERQLKVALVRLLQEVKRSDGKG